MNDQQKIKIARLLFESGLISASDLASLHVDERTGEILDDEDFPVDIMDDGDVYIHKGSYPVHLQIFGEM